MNMVRHEINCQLQTGRLYEAQNNVVSTDSTNRAPLRGSEQWGVCRFYKQVALTALNIRAGILLLCLPSSVFGLLSSSCYLINQIGLAFASRYFSASRFQI